MKDFEVGKTVLIPVKIEDKTSDAYWVRYGNEVFWVSNGCVVDDAEGKTYEDGLNDAWEAARNIFCDENQNGLPIEAIKDIFGDCSGTDIVCGISAQDAIDKIKAWEEANSIRVGDVVRIKESNVEGVVTCIDSGCYSILREDGYNYCNVRTDGIKKTGRTVDVNAILKIIRGE